MGFERITPGEFDSKGRSRGSNAVVLEWLFRLVAIGLLLAQPAFAVSIDWRTIGNPGNACDLQFQGCFGAVPYTYQIARYEVTNAEYAAFLNAVADADPNGLYSTSMGFTGGITRTGAAGSYVYGVVSGRGAWPVNYVSFLDAVRFVNWLHNNQPVGAQGNATTEDGAYTITPAGVAANSIVRNAGARVVLPNQDEWYKAAYFFYSSYQDGTFYGTGFSEYPTNSDAQTTCAAPGPTPNTASCGSISGMTPVGSYTNSASFWGTFDQGGNAQEWNETIVETAGRRVSGAGLFDSAAYLAAAEANLRSYFPTNETFDIGFRVARPMPRPFRIADIAPGGASSFAGSFTNVNGTLYFNAFDAIHGYELWKTDGTAGGTVLVKDIFPGTGSSYPYSFSNVNGTLFFVATDGTRGTELWKSNGTAAGTVIVKDIRAGAVESIPYSLTNLNGTLYFGANNGTNGWELWKSDGTAAGTVLVKDIWPGASNSFPDGFTNLNGSLYFQANDGIRGAELWKTNGTAAGTVLVTNIAIGVSGSSPWGFVSMDGKLYFTATDGFSGVEPWKSDGTAAGTELVKDIWPGSGDSSTATGFTKMNGLLFFAANDGVRGVELWKSDGTTAGTALVQDMAPGSSDSFPCYQTNVNGTLYFQARSALEGGELWKTDGTAGGTAILKDFIPGPENSWPRNLASVKGMLLLAATEEPGGSGFELWQSDGTEAGTVLVEDIWPGPDGSNPGPDFVYNGSIYFSASDGTSGAEPWRFEVVDSDGDELADHAEVGFGTDPYDVDSENDGLSDFAEAGFGSDPYDFDSDDDGLGDGDEAFTYGTHPMKPDSDGDGFDDGWEVDAGFDPVDPEFPNFSSDVFNQAVQSNDQPKYRWLRAGTSFAAEGISPAPLDLPSGVGVCTMNILDNVSFSVGYGFAPPPSPPASGFECCGWQSKCELTCFKPTFTCTGGEVCPYKDDDPRCLPGMVCVDSSVDVDCQSSQAAQDTCNAEEARLRSLGVPDCCFYNQGVTIFKWGTRLNENPIYGDSDVYPDQCDNCPALANDDQLDSDGDGLGNVCDPTPFPEPGQLPMLIPGFLWLSWLQRRKRFERARR